MDVVRYTVPDNVQQTPFSVIFTSLSIFLGIPKLTTDSSNFFFLVKSLTLRLLMSHIYMEHPSLMFIDHTQRRSTVGRTPLDE